MESQDESIIAHESSVVLTADGWRLVLSLAVKDLAPFAFEPLEPTIPVFEICERGQSALRISHQLRNV